jgi:hypothetical protein
VLTPIGIANAGTEPVNVTIAVMEGGRAVALQGSETELKASVNRGKSVVLSLPASGPSTFTVEATVAERAGGARRQRYVLPVEVKLDQSARGKTVCANDYECVGGTHCTFQHCCPVRDLPWFWSYEVGACRPDPTVLEVPARSVQLELGTETMLHLFLKNPYTRAVDIEVRLGGEGSSMASLSYGEESASELFPLLPGEERIVLARVKGAKAGSHPLVVEARCGEAACAVGEPAVVGVLVYTSSELLGDEVRVKTAPDLDLAALALLALAAGACTSSRWARAG